MKDTVLCATDFSESSEQVLQWAYRVALGANAPLAVLYSYRLIQTGKVNDILLFRRKIEEEARKKFLEYQNRFLNGRFIPVSLITEIGFYSDNIENYVRKNPNTAVVISDELANSIYEHKNLSFQNFMKNLSVPFLIVPLPLHKNEMNESQKDEVAQA